MATEVPKPHGSRQTNAYVCLSITFAAATITISLRLIARRLTKVSLWLDDYLAVLAYLFAGVWTGLVVCWLQSGLGLFLNEINMPVETALERSRLLLWNIELFYAFSLASAKLAILGFYWRMFKTSNLKRPIQTLVGCTLIWTIIRTFLAIFHCVPVAKFWRPSILGHCEIDDSKFFFGTVFVHLVIDIIILALPIIEVRKLQLPLSQRLGIMAMFGFGVFVCVASIIVMVLSIGYDATSVEMPWHVAPIIIWATAEVNLAIVSTCLPILRPIYSVIRCRPITKNGSSHTPVYAHTNSYSNALPTSHKLANLTTYEEFDNAETESTHKLASRGASVVSSTSDLGRAGHGNVTVVGVGSSEDRFDEEVTRTRGLNVANGKERRGTHSGRSSVGNLAAEGGWNGVGIRVTNETSVRSDRIA